MPSLNWRVTLLHNGRKVLTTDYGAGMAHCPFYKAGKASFRMTIWERERIMQECEKGFAIDAERSQSMIYLTKVKINPDSHDVIYSLLMDAEVLDFDGYEDWAGNFGYDEDSRKGEAVYNACMKIAMQFRKIGESVIAELREVYQDY
jgi:hypothetical protein